MGDSVGKDICLLTEADNVSLKQHHMHKSIWYIWYSCCLFICTKGRLMFVQIIQLSGNVTEDTFLCMSAQQVLLCPVRLTLQKVWIG